MRKQNGVTLLEITIMLVILGLLMGGVVTSQELIANARVRTMIAQEDAIKTAYFGFRDRYRALPGDYSAASTNIACTPACSNGDGNGIITGINDSPPAPIKEHIAVWEHLSNAGFLNGNYTYAATESSATSPKTIFGQYLILKYDALYQGTASARHNLKSGTQIPSTVLGEIDRKIDDGYATTGAYRFSTVYPSGSTQTGIVGIGTNWSSLQAFGNTASSPTPIGAGSCYAGTTPNEWSVRNPVANCGAASLI